MLFRRWSLPKLAERDLSMIIGVTMMVHSATHCSTFGWRIWRCPSNTFKAICLSMLAGPEAIPSSFTTRIQEGGHKARCRKPIWMGIPSVRLLLTLQLCEQIVGRLDIAEGHQKLA